jgi:endonuclease-3
MATPNRAALITKMHRTLRKLGKAPPHPADRSVLEHLLFACLLENAHYDTAQSVLGKFHQTFFDLNEIRVSSARELTELGQALPDPQAAVARFKRVLQTVFESSYSYDLEGLRKLNLSLADKQLRKLDGVTPFAVAYVTQTALGGHAIPLDAAALQVLYVLGLAPTPDTPPDEIPGLTRAIPKSKGFEFSYLLHELAADFWANPFSTNARNVLLAIAPDAKDRFPKRPAKKPAEEPPPPAPVDKQRPAGKAAPADKTVAADKTAPTEKPRPADKAAAEKPRADKAPPAKEPAPAAAKSAAKPKPTGKQGPSEAKSAPKARRMQKVSNRSATKALAKRKPR